MNLISKTAHTDVQSKYPPEPDTLPCEVLYFHRLNLNLCLRLASEWRALLSSMAVRFHRTVSMQFATWRNCLFSWLECIYTLKIRTSGAISRFLQGENSTLSRAGSSICFLKMGLGMCGRTFTRDSCSTDSAHRHALLVPYAMVLVQVRRRVAMGHFSCAKRGLVRTLTL